MKNYSSINSNQLYVIDQSISYVNYQTYYIDTNYYPQDVRQTIYSAVEGKVWSSKKDPHQGCVRFGSHIGKGP